MAERTIEDIREELDEARKELDNFEIDQDAHEEDYREALNSYGPVTIGSLTFDAARIVEELDETAYRCGLNDYVDGLDVEDDEGYQKIEGRIEELESELADAEEAADADKPEAQDENGAGLGEIAD